MLLLLLRLDIRLGRGGESGISSLVYPPTCSSQLLSKRTTMNKRCEGEIHFLDKATASKKGRHLRKRTGYAWDSIRCPFCSWYVLRQGPRLRESSVEGEQRKGVE
jgi:hypothetical protein